eukprot:4870222-Pyramimonas_sp.AAC.1
MGRPPRRISWPMPSFIVLRNDCGVDIHLTEVSPAMVRSLLKRVVTKTLEWDLGARLDVGRACGD